MSKKVIILQGLPGSGKTTWALNEVLNAPMGRVVRISNDDLAACVFGDKWRGLDNKAGRAMRGGMLAQVRKDMIRSLLADPAVQTVIVDNTNLAGRAVREAADVAEEMGAEVVLNKGFLAVPVEECIRRDAERERPVGARVIEDMAKMLPMALRFSLPLPMVVVPYEEDENLPYAYLCDIDGTVALMGDRGPFDWHRVGEDEPNIEVLSIVAILHETQPSVRLIFVSGRSDVCRAETEQWLMDKFYMDRSEFDLHMRAGGDNRRDSVVKYELFNRHIRGQYNVAAVFDDRDQVIHLWRRQLGLTTLQVADGNF